MPESGAKSHLVNNGKAVQSAWLTHWTGTRSETIEHDHLPQGTRIKENDLNVRDINKNLTGIEISSDNFGFSKDTDLTSLKKPSSQSFQFFKRGQESGKCSSRECHLQPTDQVKHHMFFSESNYLSSRPSDQVVYKLDTHTTHGLQNFRHLTAAFASKDHAVHHGQCSSQNVPHIVHNVERLHSFCRTTHGLLLTKQTNFKVYQESQVFRESRISTQLKGVKLQLLDSSDHESQENVQKNESSADTEAMDMDAVKENHLSGVHLFPTDKDIMADSNVEKDRCRKRKIELSDINLEISAQPDASSSAEKADPCMSRTQSLDMNKLHYNFDQTNSDSHECSNSNPTGSRWIKRLKLAETSLLEKMNRSESAKQECKEIPLWHPWIQRWSHKHSQTSPEAVESCKLDDSEFETDEFQKKQFPIVAAMALMGKAMTGLPQCKLQKRESFVVWDTKLSISNTGQITHSVLF